METRPYNCRDRLRDEGKAYPRSGCAVCKNGGLVGCPFEWKGSTGGVLPTAQTSRTKESRLERAIQENIRVLEGVLAQMDNIKEKHGTFYGDAAFFEDARQIHKNKELLDEGGD